MYKRYVFYTSLTSGLYLTPWDRTSPRVSDAWVTQCGPEPLSRPGYRAHTFEVSWGFTVDHFLEYMRDKMPGSIMSGWYLRHPVIVIAEGLDDDLHLTIDNGVYPEHSNLDASSASYRSIPRMLDAMVRNALALTDISPRFKVREVATGA